MEESKKINVMISDEKVGEITPLKTELERQVLDVEMTRVFKIDCLSKDAPEIDQIIYNGKVYKPTP